MAVAGATSTACASPEPEPIPTPTEPAIVPSSRPVTVRSFGPNGTHYPDELPWPGDVAEVELVAECDWVDIARKIEGLTSDRVDQGVVIRVKPGVLPGGGAGSSSPSVLTQVGNQEWSRNVLIVPLEGFGSVTVHERGARFDQCARVSFFGFVSEGSFVLTRCVSMQMGWSRWSAANITRGARDIDFYEIVAGFRRDANDTSGVRPIQAFPMTDITRYGCVFGPSVKPAGDSAHCDTVQIEGTGVGTLGPFISEDCVDFGSSNAVMMLQNRLTLAEYRHCMILGGQLPWTVYPLRSGDYEGNPNAFSGGCLDVRLYDSVVSGAIGGLGYTRVENTRLSYAPQASQQPSRSGEWTVDTGLAGWGADDIMDRQEIPDYEMESLAAIWTW